MMGACYLLNFTNIVSNSKICAYVSAMLSRCTSLNSADEFRCSTLKECTNATDHQTSKWLGPNAKQCPAVDLPPPVDMSLPSEKLTITVQLSFIFL